jgi:pimeloyl-ACP methyl ester carboxylesterase
MKILAALALPCILALASARDTAEVANAPDTHVRAETAGRPSASWRDPSPHKVSFVTVDDGVQLEVLDWGGSGRPVILLAGGGNTAHVFDEFAPKLATDCHVYGFTRRGFGASTSSTSEAGVDRLRDDVVAAIDALSLNKPVLVGHSIAGAESSAVGTARPDRIAGLVYLEAGYPYAFDNGKGSTMREFQELKSPQPPTPGDGDLASFSALQEWDARVYGIRTPEAEFRQTWDSTSDGRPEKARESPGSQAVMAMMMGMKKYADIRVPALVVFAIPHVPENWINESTDPGVRESARAYFAAVDALAEMQAKALETSVPTARVIRLRGAHYIFLSNESDVLRDIRAFLAGLK